MNQLQEEMAQLASGQVPTPEPISETLTEMPLVIGADGVMVPMRPHEGQPLGSTRWREVKVSRWTTFFYPRYHKRFSLSDQEKFF